MKPISLYIHIPFCRRACFYCHFFHRPLDNAALDAYIDSICAEIALYRNHAYTIATIYLGGGSPSLLSSRQLSAIMSAITATFTVLADAEITAEANPEDITPALMAEWRACGINRLSLGVQSFAQADLDFLQRGHSALDNERALHIAHQAGFNSISADLIIGLPCQTTASIERNVQFINATAISHVSVYVLEGVPLTRQPGADERANQHYFAMAAALIASGFEHYEISNYAKTQCQARHNLTYWRNQPYIGVGASAAGYLAGEDYKNICRLDRYASAVCAGRLPCQTRQRIPTPKRALITGLRLFAGVSPALFAGAEKNLNLLLTEKFLIKKGRHIALNPEKALLLNEILGYFI